MKINMNLSIPVDIEIKELGYFHSNNFSEKQIEAYKKEFRETIEGQILNCLENRKFLGDWVSLDSKMSISYQIKRR